MNDEHILHAGKYSPVVYHQTYKYSISWSPVVTSVVWWCSYTVQSSYDIGLSPQSQAAKYLYNLTCILLPAHSYAQNLFFNSQNSYKIS